MHDRRVEKNCPGNPDVELCVCENEAGVGCACDSVSLVEVPLERLRFETGGQHADTKGSATEYIGVLRLGHDAHIANARLFHRIHDRGEGTKRNILIGAHEDGLVLRIADFLPQLSRNFVDVHRVIAQEHALRFINGDHHSFFGDLLDRARFWHGNFNA